MNTFFGRTVLATAIAAALAVAATVLIAERSGPSRSIGVVAVAAFVLTLPGAVALAWWLSSRFRHGVALVERLARQHTAARGRPVSKVPGGELVALAKVLDDTFRQLQERLAEQARDRARLEAVLSGMAEGVLLADARGRVQLANDAARRMLKLGSAPMGRPYVEIVRQPDMVALLGAALAGESTEAVEVALPSDTDVTVTARAGPVRAPDGQGAVLVLHDISALRRTDRMRRDFVANVSHELRTPLTAIRGYVEALRDHPADEATRQKFLGIIDQHAQRMERLARDLLKLARLEAGIETIEPAKTDLGELARAAAVEFAAAAGMQGQRIEVDVAPGEETIVTDAHKLGDALRNLLDNAVRYGGERTTIRIVVRREGSAVEVGVLDEGSGIPEAEIPRIFERFYRLDRSRSAASGGTGLGLSIAKHLIDRLGGDIYAANREGGGAAFTIRLPLSYMGPQTVETTRADV